MKKIIALLLITGSLACKKGAQESRPAGTLTLVNTIIGGEAFKLIGNKQVVNNNAFASIGLYPGNNELYIYPISDSLHPYYSNTNALDMKASEVYTFLLGGSKTAPDALLLKETIPSHADSSMGIRFINLSPGSPAVNITLSTSTTVNEFSAVAYKDVTAFNSYPTKSTNKTYTFQVRNPTSGTVISSLTLTGTNLTTGLPRFKNITLVLRGIVGGSPSAGITRINHYQ